MLVLCYFLFYFEIVPCVSCVAFQFLPLCDFLPFFCLHLLFVSQHCVRLVCVLPDVFVRWFHFLLCVFFLASCLGLALVISGLNCAVGFLLCLASCVAAFFIVCSICFFFFFGVLFFFCISALGITPRLLFLKSCMSPVCVHLLKTVKSVPFPCSVETQVYVFKM